MTEVTAVPGYCRQDIRDRSGCVDDQRVVGDLAGVGVDVCGQFVQPRPPARGFPVRWRSDHADLTAPARSVAGAAAAVQSQGMLVIRGVIDGDPFEVRWLRDGILEGDESVLTAIKTHRGMFFATTPTGPFVQLTEDSPVAVSAFLHHHAANLEYLGDWASGRIPVEPQRGGYTVYAAADDGVRPGR